MALVDGLDVELVSPEAAKAVLCTGLFDDETEQAEDYRTLLEGFKARDLPFICANP
jgi:ribonucleotide monophosphatase NagD (HAD superfamily)